MRPIVSEVTTVDFRLVPASSAEVVEFQLVPVFLTRDGFGRGRTILIME